MFNGNLQANLLSRGDLIGLRAMDVLSENPHLVPARSLNSKEVRGAFCSARIGQPKCIRADEGSEWKNEVWADPHSECKITTPFQGLVRASGFLGAVLDLREVFIISWRKLIASKANRLSPRSTCAGIP